MLGFSYYSRNQRSEDIFLRSKEIRAFSREVKPFRIFWKIIQIQKLMRNQRLRTFSEEEGKLRKLRKGIQMPAICVVYLRIFEILYKLSYIIKYVLFTQFIRYQRLKEIS